MEKFVKLILFASFWFGFVLPANAEDLTPVSERHLELEVGNYLQAFRSAAPRESLDGLMVRWTMTASHHIQGAAERDLRDPACWYPGLKARHNNSPSPIRPFVRECLLLDPVAAIDRARYVP